MVIMTGSENYIIGEKYIYSGKIVVAMKHEPCVHIQHDNGCSGCLGRLTYIENGAVHSTCGHRNIGGTLKLVFNVISKTNTRW